MKRHLKNLFIPHHGNGFHPHLFHRKRLIGYGLSLAFIKVFLVSLVLFVPMDVYSSPVFLQEEKMRIIELINEKRDELGVPKVDIHDKLNRSSYAKAKDMSAESYFSHKGPNGESLKGYLDYVGYDFILAGENLAVGFYNAQDIVDAWVDSPSHYENLIEEGYQDTGLAVHSGVYKNKQTFFVVSHYGQPVDGNWHSSATSNEGSYVLGEEISKPGFYAKTKYYLAKNTFFEPIKKVVDTSNILSLIFIIIFGVTFMLNIIVEYKTQHIHVIRDSALLIIMLFILYML